jgi:hypothetical protein
LLQLPLIENFREDESMAFNRNYFPSSYINASLLRSLQINTISSRYKRGSTAGSVNRSIADIVLTNILSFDTKKNCK